MTEQFFIQIDNEVVEAKGDKLAYIQAWKADLETFNTAQTAAKQIREESKNSAIAKLTALGLTEQEVFDLLGITPDESKTADE
jgi:hypothetical protein